MEQMMEYVPNMYATFWALVPPLVAIILALVTKEVYSSLFIGIVIGGLFYGNIFQQGFSFEKSVLHIFEDGLVGVLSDPYNVGILIFLVVLGIMVSMMNKAGGSAAFGQWAGRHIKTRIGAQLSDDGNGNFSAFNGGRTDFLKTDITVFKCTGGVVWDGALLYRSNCGGHACNVSL